MTRFHRTIIGAAAALAVALPSQSQALGTPVIVSPPGNTYLPAYQPAVIQRGDEVTYYHLDPTGGHDVTADQFGPDDADHCFDRILSPPNPLESEIHWDPSTAQYWYVHKNWTGDPNSVSALKTLNVEDAMLDGDGNAIRKRAYPLGRCPVFYTELLNAGQVYPIEGITNVEAGTTYTYRCRIHSNMRGTIVVLPE